MTPSTEILLYQRRLLEATINEVIESQVNNLIKSKRLFFSVIRDLKQILRSTRAQDSPKKKKPLQIKDEEHKYLTHICHATIIIYLESDNIRRLHF